MIQEFEKNVLYRDAIIQLEDAASTMQLDPNILDRLRIPKRSPRSFRSHKIRRWNSKNLHGL